MAFCGFAKGAAMYDSTPIENLFLMEYLPGAPEQFVKVYLYARMLSIHPELCSGVEDMATALRTDADVVMDAMAYWEQRGLVRRLTDRPPTFELLPMNGSALDTTATMDRSYYEYRDFNADLQAFFPDSLLHPAEFTRAVDWINVMGFSQGAVLLAVKHEVAQSRSKSPNPSALFKRLDKKMLAWADRGIRDVPALERELTFSDTVRSTAATVLKRFGLRRAASEDELTAVRRWLEEWRFTPEDVEAACAETTAARNPTVAYLDAVLKNRLSGDHVAYEELAAVLKELNGSAAPTPNELTEYTRLRGLGFDFGTVKLAAVQLHRKRRNTFGDLTWMLEEWQKLGLFRLEDAEAYVNDMGRRRARMREVMKACGLERSPRMDDLQYLESWQALASDALIDYAAGCARGMQKPVLYMDKLLREWSAAGVDTVEAARAQHEARAAAKPASADANPALNYPQRDYAERDESSFFIDLEKEYGNGGEQA